MQVRNLERSNEGCPLDRPGLLSESRHEGTRCWAPAACRNVRRTATELLQALVRPAYLEICRYKVCCEISVAKQQYTTRMRRANGVEGRGSDTPGRFNHEGVSSRQGSSRVFCDGSWVNNGGCAYPVSRHLGVGRGARTQSQRADVDDNRCTRKAEAITSHRLARHQSRYGGECAV